MDKIQEITEEWTVKIWVTSDGMRHTYKDSAERHQRQLDDYDIEKMLVKKKFRLGIFEKLLISNEWVFVTNNIVKEYLIRRFAKKHQYLYINGSSNGKESDVRDGDWVALGKVYDDESGEHVQEGIYTLGFIYESAKKAMEIIDSQTVEGRF